MISPSSPIATTAPSTHVPFPSDKHKVHCAKYSTSLDSRGYIPVYEFTFNEQPILWDRETGYVYWTGIWKAIGREKSEIAKLVDSNPELSKEVKKIRGGFLKIQGTWLPFKRAYELAMKTCWYIRDDLVPIFGPQFLQDVLEPSHPNSSSRVPISMEERKSRAAEIALAKQKAKISKAGMVSPPETPNLSGEEGYAPKKVPGIQKRKREANSKSQSIDDEGDKGFISVLANGVTQSPIPYQSSVTYTFHASVFPKKSNTIKPRQNKRRKAADEAYNREFIEDPKELNEAVFASLCLQKLSQDDGSRPLNEIVCVPPNSFVIGKHEFRFINEQYRLKARC